MTSNSSTATIYRLKNSTLKIDGAANEQIEATANFVRCATAKTISFSYDHNGLRTQKKIVEGSTTTVYDYTLHGKLITHLTKTVNGTKSAEMHFFYDALGRPAMVKHGNNLYRYVHNLQGNIVGIIDGAGTLVVEYKYDAWGGSLGITGNLASTLGKENPFRYRGYTWDEETELYYLKSRYHSTQRARFVNVDVMISGGIASLNPFAYCQNNPVVRADSSGTEGYYVVLNVYDAAGWNKEYGHYDLSIISKDDPSDGWTFSYGPIFPEGHDLSSFEETDEFDARVDVYDSSNRPKMRYVLFDDFSEEELASFKFWFESNLELISKLDDGHLRRYRGKSGFYSKYKIGDARYCGSGLVYLVANMGNRISSSKNTQTALYELMGPALKVTENVIAWLSELLSEYLPNTQ